MVPVGLNLSTKQSHKNGDGHRVRSGAQLFHPVIANEIRVKASNRVRKELLLCTLRIPAEAVRER